MFEFPHPLLPGSIRARVGLIRLAILYGCLWQIWALHTAFRDRQGRSELVDHRRRMLDLYQAEGLTPAELRELAAAVRRAAV